MYSVPSIDYIDMLTAIVRACSWLFNTCGGPMHRQPCDMTLGAVTMVIVVNKLEEIGRHIVGNSSAWPAGKVQGAV